MINSRIVNISLIITGFSSLLLVIFPELDLSFSQIFFTEEDGFLYKRNFIVYNIYIILPWFTKIFTAGCVLWLVYIGVKGCNDRHPEAPKRHPEQTARYPEQTARYPEQTARHPEQTARYPELDSGSQKNGVMSDEIPNQVRDDGLGVRDDGSRDRNDGFKIIRSGVFFLFISAIIGPGLVVNTVFKENFGRARPAQIEFFKGTKEFTPAFKVTTQCQNNCSFTSGHAAMGFFFTAIAYVWMGGRLKRHPEGALATVRTQSLSSKTKQVLGPDVGPRPPQDDGLVFNKIYIAGLIFGSAVGLSRIMMGGHFLSDVIVSAFVVLLLNHIIFILWQRVVVLKK